MLQMKLQQNDILLHLNQCLTQSSPEKFLPSSDGNIYRDLIARKLATFEHLTLQGMFPSNPYVHGLGKLVEERQKVSKCQRG